MARIAVIAVFCCLVALVSSVDVPSYINVCKRRDPKLNDCIKNSIENLRDKLKTGMPDFKIASMEPLTIDDDLNLANSESFSARTKNVNIFGISAFDDLKVNMDINDKVIELIVHFSDLKLEGDYDISTKILVPITVKGPIQISIKDVTAKLLLKYETVPRKGQNYLFFNSASCKLTIKDYTSNFVPSPGQDQTLGQAINDVLNSSKQEILSSIIGTLEQGVAKKLVNTANGVGRSFTYDQLLPDIQ